MLPFLKKGKGKFMKKITFNSGFHIQTIACTDSQADILKKHFQNIEVDFSFVKHGKVTGNFHYQTIDSDGRCLVCDSKTCVMPFKK
jgi:hypothetical protein